MALKGAARKLTLKTDLRSSLHDPHHLATLLVLDDSNGVLVNWVEWDKLGALIVVPQGVLVLIAVLEHLPKTHIMPCEDSL